jgi:hypothetical protein
MAKLIPKGLQANFKQNAPLRQPVPQKGKKLHK